jgi:pimeloyl-ACP methyl ester carboxylesterase
LSKGQNIVNPTKLTRIALFALASLGVVYLPVAQACVDGTVVKSGEISLRAKAKGPAHSPAVVLVAGTGQHGADWPEALIEGLLGKGYRVVTYDPRDVGCSTQLDASGAINWPSFFSDLSSGRRPVVPYSADDLADDLVAVMNAFGLEGAHVLGASGGSTVALHAALKHPSRVTTLTLLMANAGNPARPMPAKPDRFSAVPPVPENGASPEVLRHYLQSLAAALEGSTPSRTPSELDTWVHEAAKRGINGAGMARSGAALLAEGDIRPKLKQIGIKVRVYHGSDDPLIPVESGRDVAEAVPGAKFIVIPGMGHNMTPSGVAMILKDY